MKSLHIYGSLMRSVPLRHLLKTWRDQVANATGEIAWLGKSGNSLAIQAGTFSQFSLSLPIAFAFSKFRVFRKCLFSSAARTVSMFLSSFRIRRTSLPSTRVSCFMLINQARNKLLRRGKATIIHRG